MVVDRLLVCKPKTDYFNWSQKCIKMIIFPLTPPPQPLTFLWHKNHQTSYFLLSERTNFYSYFGASIRVKSHKTSYFWLIYYMNRLVFFNNFWKITKPLNFSNQLTNFNQMDHIWQSPRRLKKYLNLILLYQLSVVLKHLCNFIRYALSGWCC